MAVADWTRVGVILFTGLSVLAWGASASGRGLRGHTPASVHRAVAAPPAGNPWSYQRQHLFPRG